MILCCIESCQLRSALGMLRTKLRKNLQRDIKKKNNLHRFVVQYYFWKALTNDSNLQQGRNTYIAYISFSE